MSKVVFLKVKWNKSPSSDVIKQILRIMVNGQEFSVNELEPSVIEYGPFSVGASSTVHVEHVCNNGFYDSDIASLDFVLGTFEKPAAVSNLSYEVIGTEDKPDVVVPPSNDTPAPVVPA